MKYWEIISMESNIIDLLLNKKIKYKLTFSAKNNWHLVTKTTKQILLCVSNRFKSSHEEQAKPAELTSHKDRWIFLKSSTVSSTKGPILLSPFHINKSLKNSRVTPHDNLPV